MIDIKPWNHFLGLVYNSDFFEICGLDQCAWLLPEIVELIKNRSVFAERSSFESGLGSLSDHPKRSLNLLVEQWVRVRSWINWVRSEQAVVFIGWLEAAVQHL